MKAAHITRSFYLEYLPPGVLRRKNAGLSDLLDDVFFSFPVDNVTPGQFFEISKLFGYCCALLVFRHRQGFCFIVHAANMLELSSMWHKNLDLFLVGFTIT